MVSESMLARVLARAAKNFSFPVRPPSYSQPSFWSEPIVITRARPIDPGLGWVDFLSVPDKESHTKIIRAYIASSYNEGQVSFRWIRGNSLLDTDTVSIPANVERHINRLVAHPYPARFRSFTFPAFDRTQVVLQANNATNDIQLAFAAVYGWYYPDLRDPYEADDLEGIDDAARSRGDQIGPRGDQMGPRGDQIGPRGDIAGSSLVRRLKIAAEQQQIPQQKPMRPADVDRRSDDIDLMYWRGSVPVPPRRGSWPQEDDQLLKIPTKQMEPVGEDSPQPIWVTGNLPAWNTPNFWAKPFEYTFTRCVPTWEEEYPIGIFTTPDMGMTIIRSVSYDVISGLNQFDLFEYKMYSSGRLKATWEDMTIDPASAAAAQRYVFSGDTIPLRYDWLVDRAKTCRFTIKARGLVDLAGASNHAPGDPINPNAHFRLNVQGYIATLRRDVDGGPRPDDLGHMEYMNLDEELQHEGMTRGAGYYPDILNR